MIRFREPSLSWINKNIIAGHILFSNTIFFAELPIVQWKRFVSTALSLENQLRIW